MADASPETTAPRRRSRRRPPGRQIARQPTDTAPQRGSVRRVRSGPDHLSAAFVQEAAANSGGFAVSRFEPEKRHGAKWGQPPSSGVSTAIAKREAASPQGCPLRWGGVAARFSAAQGMAEDRALSVQPMRAGHGGCRNGKASTEIGLGSRGGSLHAVVAVEIHAVFARIRAAAMGLGLSFGEAGFDGAGTSPKARMIKAHDTVTSWRRSWVNCVHAFLLWK